LDDMEAGVRIGERCINNLWYVDDITLLVESKENQMKLLQTVKKESEKAVFYFNLKKNEIVSTEKINVFTLGNM